MIVVMLFAALGGAGLVWWWLRRSTPRGKAGMLSKVWLIVYDGVAFDAHYCDVGVTGLKPQGSQIEYQYGMMSAIMLDDERVYIMLVERPALANHETLMIARRSVVTGALFRAGGDITQYFRIGTYITMFMFMFYLVFAFNGVSNRLAENSVIVQRLNSILSSPLVTQPAPVFEPK